MSNGSKIYWGSSQGGSATIEKALEDALAAAAKAENRNEFTWQLVLIAGDAGGIVGRGLRVVIHVA